MSAAASSSVNWLEWGPEVFEQARASRRPLLVSIGARWCFATRCFYRQFFSAPAVAQIIHQRFIPIAIDRDARPDLDAHFQRVAQLRNGRSGWPLTLFLTPDGDAFEGGIYTAETLPGGVPELVTTLKRVADLYETRKLELEARALELRAGLALPAAPIPGNRLRAELDAFADHLLGAFDMEHGGFGKGPRFPQTTALTWLLFRYQARGEGWTIGVVERTLEPLLGGALRDWIDGGFYRCTDDERWSCPELEKVLRDNLELLLLFRAARDVVSEALAAPMLETARFLIEQMLRPETWRFAVSIASSREGATPVEQHGWTREALEATLGRSLLEALEQPGKGRQPRLRWRPLGPDSRYGMVALDRSLEGSGTEGLTSTDARELLARALEARGRPLLDQTPYTSVQALTVQALLSLPREETEARGVALRLLDQCLASLSPDGYASATLKPDGYAAATPSPDGYATGRPFADGPGLLVDQASVGLAALAGFEATGSARYFDAAHRATRALIAGFWDAAGLRFLPLRRGTVEPAGLEALSDVLSLDTPGRSPAALALELLNGMALFQEDEALVVCQEQAVESLAARWRHFGVLSAGVMTQVMLAIEPPPVVFIVGAPHDPRTIAFRDAALRSRRIGRRVVTLDPAVPPKPISGPLNGLLQRYRPAFGPGVYLLWDGVFEPGPESPGELEVRVGTIGRSR